MKPSKICQLLTIGLLVQSIAAAADDRTIPWPDHCRPADVGLQIALNLLKRNQASKSVAYPEVCTAFGSLRLAGELKDKDLLDKLVDRYAPMLTPQGKHLVPRPNGVDHSVFGVVPLEIYLQTGDADYLAVGKTIADTQWQDASPDGLSKQTRFWLDDMFMIIGLQTQAFRATKDQVYLDRAATEMTAYIDKLQQPSGLFFHSTGPGRFCWGRANGWMAVGMAELLSELPENHPQRSRILESYCKLMDALVNAQDGDGMWRQVLDDEESWPESSCTGMFVFSLARGVANGWLTGPQYAASARSGWIALCGYLDQDSNVREVCIGTSRGNDEDFYLDRPRAVGDLHGQAAVVWAAWALIKLDDSARKVQQLDAAELTKTVRQMVAGPTTAPSSMK